MAHLAEGYSMHCQGPQGTAQAKVTQAAALLSTGACPACNCTQCKVLHLYMKERV